MSTPNANTRELNINNGLPKYPGGRFRSDGPASGAVFREDHLAPALLDDSVDHVRVVLDGAAGFGHSFLEESFGGLVREHGLSRASLNERLSVVTADAGLQPYLARIAEYIDAAASRAEAD